MQGQTTATQSGMQLNPMQTQAGPHGQQQTLPGQSHLTGPTAHQMGTQPGVMGMATGTGQQMNRNLHQTGMTGMQPTQQTAAGHLGQHNLQGSGMMGPQQTAATTMQQRFGAPTGTMGQTTTGQMGTAGQTTGAYGTQQTGMGTHGAYGQQHQTQGQAGNFLPYSFNLV